MMSFFGFYVDENGIVEEFLGTAPRLGN